MIIEIYDPEMLLGPDFGMWLIKRVKQHIIINLDPKKLIVWDDFFNNKNNGYVSLYNKKISTYKLILQGADNLRCLRLPDRLVIRFNANQYFKGLDRVPIEATCKLINFGTIDLPACPVFINAFRDVVDNINRYVHEFETGVFI